MPRPLRSPSLRRRARGLTLVELMVALVISFLLVGAAAYLYLSTRESQRSVDSAASANDVGVFAMQTISRELMSAGFFPARWSQPGRFSTTRYDYAQTIPTVAGKLPFQFGIFGCKNGRFDVANARCVAHEAPGGDGSGGTRGDSLVVSYFTLDPGNRGQRMDCAGNNVDNDTTRNATTRVWGEAGASDDDKAPVAPMMVINSYNLSSAATEVEGRKSTAWSLSCFGNGSERAGYAPLVSGVEQLRFTYGLRPAGEQAPSAETYVDADAVGTAWDQVISVRVCMVVKAADAGGTKLSDTQAGARSYVDCDGQPVTQASTDTALYKTYIQTFGVRNNQTMTY